MKIQRLEKYLIMFFHVRVDVCSGFCYETDSYGYRQKKDFFWHSTLYTLTIGTGGKYSMRAGY